MVVRWRLDQDNFEYIILEACSSIHQPSDSLLVEVEFKELQEECICPPLGEHRQERGNSYA